MDDFLIDPSINGDIVDDIAADDFFPDPSFDGDIINEYDERFEHWENDVLTQFFELRMHSEAYEAALETLRAARAPHQAALEALNAANAAVAEAEARVLAEMNREAEEENANPSERQLLIRELREENENPVPVMSRACRVCLADSPLQRAVFTACGHAVCVKCSVKLSEKASKTLCPLCEIETGNVLLFEDHIEEVKTDEPQEEDKKSPTPAVSRSCRVCFVDSPFRRAVFTVCGHAVCRACAEKLADVADRERKELTCSFCRTETGFVPIVEDPIDGLAN